VVKFHSLPRTTCDTTSVASPKAHARFECWVKYIALPNVTLGDLPFSARKGMRSGLAPSSLPRGTVAGVAPAPAPPGVCATGRGVAAPPLLLFANIVLG
jgi:hypothetical protein